MRLAISTTMNTATAVLINVNKTIWANGYSGSNIYIFYLSYNSFMNKTKVSVELKLQNYFMKNLYY